MKLSFFLLFMSLAAFAGEDGATYTSDPAQIGRYKTGYVKRELTLEEHKASSEFVQKEKDENWTFDHDVTQISRYKKLVGGFKPGLMATPPVKLFRDDQKFKSASLNDSGMPAAPILDQGQCGSCVPSAFTGGTMDIVLQRGVQLPGDLSIGALMWCSHGQQCDGADGETIAQDLVTLGGLPSNKDVPYIPRNGNCPNTSKFDKFGNITGWQTIDGSAKSILAAIHNRMPVMCGVAADNTYMAYKGGVYNPQSFSMGTNHYNKVRGLDCEDAVDANGDCVFDASGNLPPGKGILEDDNSWNTSWGEAGRARIRMTNKRGTRTNNICGGSGNAQVLTTSLPIPPSTPVTFTLTSVQLTLTVTVQPTSKASSDVVKAGLQSILNQLDGK